MELQLSRWALGFLCTPLMAASGCHAAVAEPADVRAERVLRTARWGITIADVEKQVGPLEFQGQESGPMTIGGIARCRGTGFDLALGIVPDPEAPADRNPELAFRQSRYIGFFNIEGPNIKSLRWIYSDGLIQDEREVLAAASDVR